MMSPDPQSIRNNASSEETKKKVLPALQRQHLTVFSEPKTKNQLHLSKASKCDGI